MSTSLIASTGNLHALTCHLVDPLPLPNAEPGPVRHSPDITSIVEVDEKSISIGFAGYGEHGAAEGYGRPIYIEHYDGKLRLIVFADINSEDPTHVIDLVGALESLRK